MNCDLVGDSNTIEASSESGTSYQILNPTTVSVVDPKVHRFQYGFRIAQRSLDRSRSGVRLDLGGLENKGRIVSRRIKTSATT